MHAPFRLYRSQKSWRIAKRDVANEDIWLRDFFWLRILAKRIASLLQSDATAGKGIVIKKEGSRKSAKKTDDSQRPRLPFSEGRSLDNEFPASLRCMKR
jgi:hypothetical protein